MSGHVKGYIGDKTDEFRRRDWQAKGENLT